jgi:hypothetical protein
MIITNKLMIAEGENLLIGNIILTDEEMDSGQNRPVPT